MEDKTMTANAVATLAMLAIHGYVLSVLWGWFIVTTFKLPALSWIQAAGLILIFIFMTIRLPKPENDNWKKFGRRIVFSLILKPIFFLLLGYIIHLLI